MPFRRIADPGPVPPPTFTPREDLATEVDGGALPAVKPLFGGAGVTKDGGGSNTTTTDTGSDLVIVFRTQRDARVRPSHAALEGRTWAIDDPLAPAPPLGYGCRCSVELIRADKVPAGPSSDAAALKKFPDLDDNIDRYMGAEIAGLYRRGDLKAGDLLRPTGDPIGVTEARVIASARRGGSSPTAGLKALADLNGMGLDDRTVRSIASQAQAKVDAGADQDDALRSVIGGMTRVGLLASRSPTVRAARTAKAIDRFRSTGLLRDAPPPPPRVQAPPAPPPPPSSGIPSAKQTAQVALEGRPFTQPTSAPYAAGQPPAAPAYVVDGEKLIARRTTERLLVWDDTGQLVGDSEGGKNYATVPRGMPRNAVWTHNHPSGQTYADSSPRAWGTSLSDADVIQAAATDAARIRAVSPSGMVFEMARPPGGWPSIATLKAQHARADTLVGQQLLQEVLAGRMTADQAGAVHYHLVNTVLAKAVNAGYTWGRHV